MKEEHSVLPLQYMYIRGNQSLVCKVLALFLGQSTDVCQMNNPYLGVFPAVVRALNKAFLADL